MPEPIDSATLIKALRADGPRRLHLETHERGRTGVTAFALGFVCGLFAAGYFLGDLAVRIWLKIHAATSPL